MQLNFIDPLTPLGTYYLPESPGPKSSLETRVNMQSHLIAEPFSHASFPSTHYSEALTELERWFSQTPGQTENGAYPQTPGPLSNDRSIAPLESHVSQTTTTAIPNDATSTLNNEAASRTNSKRSRLSSCNQPSYPTSKRRREAEIPANVLPIIQTAIKRNELNLQQYKYLVFKFLLDTRKAENIKNSLNKDVVNSIINTMSMKENMFLNDYQLTEEWEKAINVAYNSKSLNAGIKKAINLYRHEEKFIVLPECIARIRESLADDIPQNSQVKCIVACQEPTVSSGPLIPTVNFLDEKSRVELQFLFIKECFKKIEKDFQNPSFEDYEIVAKMIHRDSPFVFNVLNADIERVKDYRFRAQKRNFIDGVLQQKNPLNYLYKRFKKEGFFNLEKDMLSKNETVPNHINPVMTDSLQRSTLPLAVPNAFPFVGGQYTSRPLYNTAPLPTYEFPPANLLTPTYPPFAVYQLPPVYSQFLPTYYTGFNPFQ